MLFSSLTFLTLFLPAFLAIYFLIPARLIRFKNVTLLVFSLFFYAIGEPIWVLLLVFTGLWDYFVGLLIARSQKKWQAKALLILTLCVNIGLLCTFKYSASIFRLFGAEGGEGGGSSLSLPIGISFYTFQAMSYIIDLYKGHIKPQRDPVALMSYVAMFPQLLSGPIVRYADVKEKFSQRPVTLAGFSSGITRFAAGLGKKVIFANHAGGVATELLSAAPGAMTTAGVWFGAVMFMFQVYFDFSGYSDMAIGLAKMIGFDFKENFDHPYTAKSITDFWRRWHISLSTWFRDYVYLPLSSALVKRKWKMAPIYIVASLAVWLLTGLWHGGSINFLIWGLFNCVMLILERFVLLGLLQKIPVFIGRLYSLLIILIAWLIFYYTDLSALAAAGATLIGLSGSLTNHDTNSLFLANIWILPVLALFSTKLPSALFQKLKSRIPAVEPVYNAALLGLSFALMVGQSFNPFLYFRF